MANVNLLAVEMDRGNESIFVPANVEHDEVADFVCGWEGSAQGLKGRKVLPLHNGEPPSQRTFAIWMLCPKLAEHFARDDVHPAILSQNEIVRNRHGVNIIV